MKKMEWMVAAGSVAALVGALYSAGCVKTASDCTLLGSCGGGGGTSTASESSAGGSSTATSTASVTASVTATSTAASTTASTSTSSSSSSSTGTGGVIPVAVCSARHYGGVGNQVARSVDVATGGDILFAGDLTGPLTLGITTVAPKQGKDLFVARVSSAWEAQWLKSFPVSYGAIAYDALGATVLAGAFAGPVDFGCGTMLDFPDDHYVVKLDANGTCAWQKGFVAAGAHVNVALDAAGQIALAGDANGAVDFHTPGGALVITDGTGGGGRDLFVTTLDKDGNVVSPKAYGGAGDDVINAVAFDGAGGVVVAGAFQSGTLQITSGGNPLSHSMGALDEAFVARIKSGAGTWALGFPGDGAAQASGVAVVGGVPIVAGHFTKTMDIGGGTTLTATGTGDDLFLLGIKIVGPAASVGWNKAFLGAGAMTVSGFATNGTDALALTGTIDGDVDFGLGTLTAAKGIYVANVASADGKALWNHAFGATDAFLTAYGVALDSAGVHVAGSYGDPLDLGDNMPMVNGGGADLFVATFATACP